MQELIQRLMQQAHLSQGQAQQVINVALNFIRSRVPALAPYLGGLGGSSASSTTTGTPASQGGGMLGSIEGMLGGGTGSSTNAAPTGSTPVAQGGGGMLGGIEGMLGGLFSGSQGGLHQELVQNAGLSQSQAAASTNVIKDFVTQHIPAASSMMQEGGMLDNVEDRVDNMLGIKDNPTNK